MRMDINNKVRMKQLQYFVYTSALLLVSLVSSAQTNTLSGRFFISGAELVSGKTYKISGTFEDPQNLQYGGDAIEGDIIAEYYGKIYKITEFITRVPYENNLEVKAEYLGENAWSFPQLGMWGALFRPTSNNGYPLAPVDPNNLGLQIAIQNEAIIAIDKDVTGFGSGTTAEKPSSPKAGQGYFDVTLGKTYIFNGVEWIGLEHNLAGVLARGTDGEGQAISNIANPVDPQDAATKYYVDRHTIPGGAILPPSGTAGEQFYNVIEKKLYVYTGSEWVAAHALEDRKLFVGNANNIAVGTDKKDIPLSGFGNAAADVSMGNAVSQTYFKITNMADPVADQDAATKKYADLRTLATGGVLPATGTAGDQFLLNTDKKIYVYTGASWMPLNKLDAGKIYLGNASNVVSEVTLSGDATLDNTGALIIVDGAVTESKVANNAIGIDKLKTDAAYADKLYATDESGVPVLIEKGAAIPSQATPPAVTVTGAMYHDTDDNQLYVYDGTKWKVMNTVPVLSAAPTDPTDGQQYFHSAEKVVYTYNLATTSWHAAGLPGLESGRIFVGDASDKATAVTLSGDATLDNTGALTIVDGAVTESKVANNAIGIDKLKTDAAYADKLYATDESGVPVLIEKGAAIPSQATPPAVTVTGAMYHDTDDNQLYVYDGTKWKVMNTVPVLSAPPTDPADGQQYFHSAEKVVYTFNLATTSWHAAGLPVLQSGRIFVGDASDMATAVMMSGDVTLDNAGKASITDASVTVAKLVTAGAADADKVYVTDVTGKPTLVAQTTIGGRTPSGGTNERPDPADPAIQLAPGDTFYDTDLKIFYVFNGTTWEPVKDNLGNHTASENLKLGTFSVSNDGAAGKGLTFDMTGNAAFGQDVTVNGNFYTPSDRRLKTGIETLSNVLEAINQMRGVKFEYKDQKRYASGPKIGVIAQELQKVYPEMVTTGSNGYLKVDYTQLSAVLIEAVKAQQKQITLLNDRLDSQQKQIDEIMKRLSAN